MMAGNPNWWSMNNMHLSSPASDIFSSQYVPTGSSSLLPFNSLADNNQDFPQSWSQLLLGGSASNEDKYDLNQFHSKKLENWEEEILNPSARIPFIDAKPEALSQQSGELYGHGEEELHTNRQAIWSQIMPVSSPRSCVTSVSTTNNILDFSHNFKAYTKKNQVQDHSSECISTATNGPCKKARVQCSSQPPLKVRKEKLGDRITALHQLVSPFGKTDTASVLLETIGYIRFLQSQIEALSSPYLGNASGNMRNNQNSVQGERNFIFPQDPGQLVNENSVKKRGASYQEGSKDLRSRGLCLVPVSCTHHVGSDNGADFWTPVPQGGF